MKNVRNVKFAKFILNLHRIYWFFVRPDSQGVKIILRTPEEKFLLVRLTYYPNSWTFPGGGVLRGESIHTAAQRELEEETGVVLTKDSIFYLGSMLFNHEYKKDTLHIYKAISKEMSAVVDGKEVAEVGWFSKNKLPVMGPNARKILDFYEKNNLKNTNI